MDIPYLNEGVLVAGSALAGAIGTRLIDFFKAKKAEERSDTEQAVGIYRGLVDELLKKQEETAKRLGLLEKNHHDCLDKNEALEKEVMKLKARVAELESQAKS